MQISHRTVESYRIAMAGLLVVFAAKIFFEIGPTIYVGAALGAIVLGVVLSFITAKHFGHDHHRSGDSAIDVIPVAVLLFANIAHPAIDGFSAVETFRVGGILAGGLYAVSIVFHELFRQSAFAAALAPLRIHWRFVVGTALIGLTTGVMASIGGARFFGRYEILADIATLFSYSFVIAEFYVIQKKERHTNTRYTLFFTAGVFVAICIIVFSSIH